MTGGLLDTSVLIAREQGRTLDEERLPERLSISVVTIGELRAGVLAATDPSTIRMRLETLEAASVMTALPVDQAVAVAWARLRSDLLGSGRRMPANDSWIAATAMALDLAVVTQDDDFDVDVAGLEVIRV